MKGRVVVISGATGGLGKAAAHAFAERGASLAVLSSDQSKLDVLARDLNLPSDRILSRAVQLRDGEAVRAAAEGVAGKFGRVDALIHLVGGWAGGKTIVESNTDDLESMLVQHVWTTFNLLQALVPKLVANQWGRVLAVSSPSASHPPARSGPYAAAKAAQEALLISLAQELKGTGVTSNIILVKSIDAEGKGTGTTPAEIVASMLYLCSDEAGKVNGARIPLFN